MVFFSSSFFHQKYTNHHVIQCFRTLVNSIIDVYRVWPPNLCELLYQTKDWTPNLFICGFLHNPTGSCFKRSLDSPISVISLILSPTPPYPLIFPLSFSQLSPFHSLNFLSHFSQDFPTPHLSALTPLIQSLLIRVQIITFSLFPMQSHFYPKSLETIISFEDSLETCSKCQMVFNSELPKGTNNTRELT